MYSVLTATFCYCGLCLSMVLRHAPGLPDLKAFAVAFIVTLLLFYQLRVADEFKDHTEDCLYQPERPVPRGLVTLKELGVSGIFAAAIQIALTIWLKPQLLNLLVATWGYFAVMSKEFFARDWLRKRPFMYLVTHNFILVCVDLYITACDWMVAGNGPPKGLILFLAVSTMNGVILEIGRKLKAPQDERFGVETYTQVWGLKRAAAAWLAAVSLSAIFVWLTAGYIGFGQAIAPFLTLMLVVASLAVGNFIRRPKTNKARFLDKYSAIWILCMYAALGIVPALMRLF